MDFKRDGYNCPLHSRSVSFIVELFCLIMILIVPLEAVALDRTISLTNGCAFPGATTQIEILLSEVDGFAGGNFEIEYDSNIINVLDVNTTALTSDFLLSHGNNIPGQLLIAMASAEGLPAGGPSAIARISLEVVAGTPIGTRTPITLREARWYTELSVRQSLFGDNAVIEAGSIAPAEDGGIVFSMDSVHGRPDEQITSGIWISLPAGVAQLEAILTYDAISLLSPSVELAPSLMGWSQEVQYSSGQIHFLFSNTTELSGTDITLIASCTWTLSPDAISGSEIDMAVSNSHASNLGDFRYRCLDGANTVIVDPPEPLLVNHWEEY